MEKVIVIFGSSGLQPGSEEYGIAWKLGGLLASAGFTICNGGYGGAMEATARGAKEAGGKTIGVTMDFVSTQPNPWIDRNIVVKTLVDRLLKLIELGEAYVVLPGGTGTLLELAAVWELARKQVMPRKPIVVLGDFWRRTIETVEREPGAPGFAKPSEPLTIVGTPEECVECLKCELGMTSLPRV